MPTLSLFEQHRRNSLYANDKTECSRCVSLWPTAKSKIRYVVPIVSLRNASRRVYVPLSGRRTTDGRWLRGDARDTKRANPMASQSGCCRSGPIHPVDPRHCRLITGLAGLTRGFYAVCDRSLWMPQRIKSPPLPEDNESRVDCIVERKYP
jgi:hypothetical protein